MADKPADLPVWATDPAAEIVQPSSGKQELGWEEGEEPPHTYFNWWQWLVYTWLLYLNDGALEGDHSIDGELDVTGRRPGHGDDYINLSPPEAHAIANWGESDGVGWGSTGAGDLRWPVSLPRGSRLKGVRYRVSGDGAADLVTTVRLTTYEGEGTPTDLIVVATHTDTNPAAAAYATQTIALDGFSSAGVQIDVNSGAKTFTRASGSFTADGFKKGHSVTFAGLANAANAGPFTITAITATVITCSGATGLVTETGSGDESATAHGVMIGDRDGIVIQQQATATGLFVDGMELRVDRPPLPIM